MADEPTPSDDAGRPAVSVGGPASSPSLSTSSSSGPGAVSAAEAEPANDDEDGGGVEVEVEEADMTSSRASVSSWLLVADEVGDDALSHASVEADGGQREEDVFAGEEENKSVDVGGADKPGGNGEQRDGAFGGVPRLEIDHDEEEAARLAVEALKPLEPLEVPDEGEDSDSCCRDLEELLPAHYQGFVHDLRLRRKQRLSQFADESARNRESSSESVSIIGDSGAEDSGSEALPALVPRAPFAPSGFRFFPSSSSAAAAGPDDGPSLPSDRDLDRPRLLEPDTDAEMSSSYFGGESSSLVNQLPANLNVFQPERKYVHTPNKRLSVALNLFVALAVVLALGIGVGHFLGWSEQSEITESIQKTTTRKMERLNSELSTCKRDLDDDVDEDDQRIKTLSVQNSLLRERIRELESENGDLRLNLSRVVESYEDKVERLSLEREVMASALEELKAVNVDELKLEVEQSRQIDSLMGEIRGLKTLIDGLQKPEPQVAADTATPPGEESKPHRIGRPDKDVHRRSEQTGAGGGNILDSSLFDDVRPEPSAGHDRSDGHWRRWDEQSCRRSGDGEWDCDGGPAAEGGGRDEEDEGVWHAFEELLTDAWGKMRDVDAVKTALAGCKTVSDGVAKRFCKFALALNELAGKAGKKASSSSDSEGGEAGDEGDEAKKKKKERPPFMKNFWEALRAEKLTPDVEWEQVDFRFVAESVNRVFDDMKGRLFTSSDTNGVDGDGSGGGGGEADGRVPPSEALKNFVVGGAKTVKTFAVGGAETVKTFAVGGAETVKTFAVDFKERMLGKWHRLREMASSPTVTEKKEEVNAFVENVFAGIKKLPRVWNRVWTGVDAGDGTKSDVRHEPTASGVPPAADDGKKSRKNATRPSSPQPPEPEPELKDEQPSSDWIFERAKMRDSSRNEGSKANWVFERAKARRGDDDDDSREDDGSYRDDDDDRRGKKQKYKGQGQGTRSWKKGRKERRKEKQEYKSGYRGR